MEPEIQSQPLRPEAEKSEPMAKVKSAGITKPGYEPESTGYAYMIVEGPNFDAKTGRKLSSPYPCSFNEGDWRQFLQFRTSQGLEVIEILHLPEGWPEPEIFKFANQ